MPPCSYWDFTPVTVAQHLAEDVNRDGTVNLHDLRFVASRFGQHGTNDADVNADGVVNIVDSRSGRWRVRDGWSRVACTF